MTAETKVCITCGLPLPLTAFYPKRDGADGRSNECRECACKRQRQYHAGHLEVIREKSRENYQKRTHSFRGPYAGELTVIKDPTTWEDLPAGFLPGRMLPVGVVKKLAAQRYIDDGACFRDRTGEMWVVKKGELRSASA